MKQRRNETRSASPAAPMSSALSPVKPPAAISVRLNFGRKCRAAIGPWPLAISSMPFDTRFEHVEVGNAQSIKLGHYMAKGRGRVAVRHRTVGAARRDTDAHRSGPPTEI